MKKLFYRALGLRWQCKLAVLLVLCAAVSVIATWRLWLCQRAHLAQFHRADVLDPWSMWTFSLAVFFGCTTLIGLLVTYMQVHELAQPVQSFDQFVKRAVHQIRYARQSIFITTLTPCLGSVLHPRLQGEFENAIEAAIRDNGVQLVHITFLSMSELYEFLRAAADTGRLPEGKTPDSMLQAVRDFFNVRIIGAAGAIPVTDVPAQDPDMLVANRQLPQVGLWAATIADYPPFLWCETDNRHCTVCELGFQSAEDIRQHPELLDLKSFQGFYTERAIERYGLRQIHDNFLKNHDYTPYPVNKEPIALA